MDTTLLIKTNKALKSEAARLAQELGVPLTTVINAYLGQFVRERKLSLSLDQTISQKKLLELLVLSKEMDKGKNIGTRAKNAEELFAHLSV